MLYICRKHYKQIKMDTRTETMQPCTIAYMRRTGAYGIECKAVMEQLKLWAKQTNNLNDDSIVLGIALDNPEVTAPESCRYDACLVVSNNFQNLQQNCMQVFQDIRYSTTQRFFVFHFRLN